LCAAFLDGHLPHQFKVQSAGFRKDEGKPAARSIRDHAQTLGLDLSQHRSQTVTPALLQWANLVVYMDGGNKNNLDSMILLNPGLRVRSIGLGSYADPPVKRIRDPAFYPVVSKQFQDIVELVIAASRNFVKRLKEEQSKVVELS